MAVIKRAVAGAALLSGAFALPRQTRFEQRQDLPSADERTQGVVDAFRTAWEGYVQIHAYARNQKLTYEKVLQICIPE